MVAEFITWLGIDGSLFPELHYIFQSIVGIFIIWLGFNLIMYVWATLMNSFKIMSK